MIHWAAAKEFLPSKMDKQTPTFHMYLVRTPGTNHFHWRSGITKWVWWDHQYRVYFKRPTFKIAAAQTDICPASSTTRAHLLEPNDARI